MLSLLVLLNTLENNFTIQHCFTYAFDDGNGNGISTQVRIYFSLLVLLPDYRVLSKDLFFAMPQFDRFTIPVQVSSCPSLVCLLCWTFSWLLIKHFHLCAAKLGQKQEQLEGRFLHTDDVWANVPWQVLAP